MEAVSRDLPELIDKLQDGLENANTFLAAQNDFFQPKADEMIAPPIAPPTSLFTSIINVADGISFTDESLAESMLTTPILPVNGGKKEEEETKKENNELQSNTEPEKMEIENGSDTKLEKGEEEKQEEKEVQVEEDKKGEIEGKTDGEIEEKKLTNDKEGDEIMEVSSSEKNDSLQQTGTEDILLSKEGETNKLVVLPISPTDSDLVSHIPSSSVMTSDSIICEGGGGGGDPASRDVSESSSPDKHLPLLETISSASGAGSNPSGIASFSLSSVTVPDDALPASVNMLTHNFPKRHRHVHRAAVYAMHPYHRATCRGGAGVSVAKTLDLLKAVLQTSFNQELKTLCDDYLQIFTLAAANINDNTHDHIPPSTLKLLVTKMLEEAQQGYQNGKWEFPSGQLPKNERVSDSKGPPMSTKKSRNDKEQRQYANAKRGRKPSEKASENSRSTWRWSLDKRRLDPGKWSTDKLNSQTLFVLGVNVNKALGHAANRGKVYILHPELFKYVCDGDDKTWLYDNKHLPVHGGKAFLLIYDEVESLVKTEHCYRDNVEILKSVQKLQRFPVPQFMENKMKEFVRNVQGYFAQESSTGSTNGIIEEALK